MNIKTLVLASLVSLTLFGCEQEGRGERAGRKLDERIESAEDRAEDAIDERDRAVRTRERMDDRVEDIRR